LLETKPELKATKNARKRKDWKIVKVFKAPS
jgi:hypothetical protein